MNLQDGLNILWDTSDNVREWGFQILESCVEDARHQPGPQCPKSLWGDIHPSRRFKQRQRRQRCPWVEAHARCALSNLCMSLATAHWSNRTFLKLAKWASMGSSSKGESSYHILLYLGYYMLLLPPIDNILNYIWSSSKHFKTQSISIPSCFWKIPWNLKVVALNSNTQHPYSNIFSWRFLSISRRHSSDLSSHGELFQVDLTHFWQLGRASRCPTAEFCWPHCGLPSVVGPHLREFCRLEMANMSFHLLITTEILAFTQSCAFSKC